MANSSDEIKQRNSLLASNKVEKKGNENEGEKKTGRLFIQLFNYTTMQTLAIIEKFSSINTLEYPMK